MQPSAQRFDKGVPLNGGAHGNVLRGDTLLPAAVLRQSVLQRNSRWMRDYLRKTGVEIAPHGKTTMIPEIFRMQIADGAWGITLSTVQQVQVARAHGIARVFFANVLAGRGEIAWVCGELDRDPGFEFCCLVDSLEALSELVATHEAGRHVRPLDVLVELGYPGGRTGCRSAEEALRLARCVAAAGPAVRLRGIEGFEGLISAASAEARDAAVRDFAGRLRRLAEAVAAEGLFAVEDFFLSAGGSGFLDIVVAELSAVRRTAAKARLLVRSGCYISFDSGMYVELFERMRARSAEGFESDTPQAALEVWSRVISRPEPVRAIVAAGKRDLGSDVAMPRVLKWHSPGSEGPPLDIAGAAQVVELNDQHAHLAIAADSPLRYGDLVGFGVSHPCTTFDRWRVILLVDDDYDIVELLRTHF